MCIIDRPKEVSSVFVNTMLNTGDAIFGTTGLKVEVSEDGKKELKCKAAKTLFPLDVYKRQAHYRP